MTLVWKGEFLDELNLSEAEQLNGYVCYELVTAKFHIAVSNVDH